MNDPQKASKSYKKIIILGQDLDVLVAVVANIVSWFVRKFFPSWLPRLVPRIDEEDTEAQSKSVVKGRTRCVVIGRPGGMEQLRLITLRPGFVTRGYNVVDQNRGNDQMSSPFVNVQHPALDASILMKENHIVLRIKAFSVNYADCCIRWGLYESANKFVGWPIVPGFDIAGVVERVLTPAVDDDRKTENFDNCQGEVDLSSSLKPGDEVYGATFFGGYSSRAVVPASQLRKIPAGLSMTQAASIPAVSLTALYALLIGGLYPMTTTENSLISLRTNRSILIHSAAGGVGSMLVQMSKLLGLSPVVGVVGRSSKVDEAKALGCDVVIDKSSSGPNNDWWEDVQRAAPNGYAMIADANGVSTLSESFDHLAPTGRLVAFGFHSNLPMGQDMLSPVEWLKMVVKVAKMPKFDAMDLTASNKAVMGFNLSFFTDEIELLCTLYNQIGTWLSEKKLRCPRIVDLDIKEIAHAHELLHSGTTVGKLVMTTGE